MADVAAEIMQRNKLKAEDIAWLVPHQANLRIIDATGRRMGLPPEKVMINIQNYGNTTTATIPLCLWEYEKKLKKGDKIILAALAEVLPGALFMLSGLTTRSKFTSNSSVNILFFLAIVFIFVSYYVCTYNSGKKWESSTKLTTAL